MNIAHGRQGNTARRPPPLLWTFGVNAGRLTKEEFAAVTSANIAPENGDVVFRLQGHLMANRPSPQKIGRGS